MPELEAVIKEVGTKLEIMFDAHYEAFYGIVRDGSGNVLFDTEGCNSIKEVVANLREIAEYPDGRGDKD
jgi:translation initiation factor 2 alpha subunit (eIF-2alpha)